MPEISIIANFYKSERFISKLINSVLKQSFKDWELIAVNDCSPGNDLKLLRKYEELPEMRGRMRIINNEINQGVSFAKNTGIRAARGKYLTFIDGDDWLEPLALEKMYTVAEQKKLDLVVANCYRVFKGIHKKLCPSAYIEFDKIYDSQGIKKKVMKAFFGINVYSSVGYWGKLFRRSTLEKSNYRPLKIVASEDLFFNLEFLLVAERMMFIEYPAYNWRWGGISSGATNKKEASFSAIGTLNNFNDFYYRRLKVIEDYDFPEGLEPLRIELYNILRSSLDSVCASDPDTESGKSAKDVLREVISLPAYREILKLRGNSYIENPRFLDALENKDIEWLYDFYHDIYRRGWKKRTVRRILSHL